LIVVLYRNKKLEKISAEKRRNYFQNQFLLVLIAKLVGTFHKIFKKFNKIFLILR